MPSISRRNFLKHAAASAGAGAVFTIAVGTKSSGSILGANDTVRIGVAGIHGRGQVHMGQFARMPGVKVTYLIDPDASLSRKSGEEDPRVGRYTTPTCVQDIRKVLDDKNLDAISIATPQPLARAGDDLGLPGRQGCLRREACAYNSVRRAEDASRRPRSTSASCNTAPKRALRGKSERTVAAIASGEHRQVCWSPRPMCRRSARSIGYRYGPKPTPATLDYNLWLGPAPKRPCIPRHFSTTTGIGSGTTATARLVTRAPTSWTSPAGASRAGRCRNACSAWAAAGSSQPPASLRLPTRVRRPTCW